MEEDPEMFCADLSQFCVWLSITFGGVKTLSRRNENILFIH